MKHSSEGGVAITYLQQSVHVRNAVTKLGRGFEPVAALFIAVRLFVCFKVRTHLLLLNFNLEL